MEIRKATLKDAKDICDIANSNALINVSKGQIKNGFLVSNFEIKDYETYIEKYKYFFVLVEDEIIHAFLFAYSSDELDNKLIVNQKIKDYAKKPYVVIKQICVNRSSSNRGYATKLYEHFIEYVGKDIFLAVVLEPYNEASINFHNKMKFDQIFTIKAEDRIKRGIFYRSNSDNDECYDKDIILSQYEIAIELYRHEDELNWSKMNHLFYITGGFVALLSILLSTVSGLLFNLSICVISLIGIMVSYLFYIAISNGINYMQKRKRAVVDIEHIIIKLNGVRVVSSKFDKDDKKFRKSPTTNMMKIIPKLLILVWSFVFCGSLILLIINAV